MGNGEWDDSGEWEIEMGIWKKNYKNLFFLNWK